ncbi:MAG: glycosyltransferase family 2 protein [Candidatus Promineifilaceae bacterium]|nr:glycosyltransferase family 2 protein [Candidatus Promineifilaceae bacterium]
MPDPAEITFSVIIPNFNGRVHLDVCLSSLRLQEASDFEIILVDNASSDDSAAYVQEHYPEVRVVRLQENRGFTGACNVGASLAIGRYIVLLNNDTEVDSGWLCALGDAFERHPRVGIVASKILLFDDRQRFHAAGDFYRVDGIPGNRGVWELDVSQYDEEEYVFSACGAAAAYRRQLIEEIGFLDDRFFFSCEDVDMGWRANLAGWRVLYAPNAIAYHKLKATGGSVTGSYYDGRNFLYLIWKDYPTSLLRRYWPAIVRSQLRLAWQALRSWRGAAARARLRGMLAGFLGLFRMLPQRRRIQRERRLSDDKLMERLKPVDWSSRAS